MRNIPWRRTAAWFRQWLLPRRQCRRTFAPAHSSMSPMPTTVSTTMIGVGVDVDVDIGIDFDLIIEILVDVDIDVGDVVDDDDNRIDTDVDVGAHVDVEIVDVDVTIAVGVDVDFDVETSCCDITKAYIFIGQTIHPRIDVVAVTEPRVLSAENIVFSYTNKHPALQERVPHPPATKKGDEILVVIEQWMRELRQIEEHAAEYRLPPMFKITTLKLIMINKMDRFDAIDRQFKDEQDMGLKFNTMIAEVKAYASELGLQKVGSSNGNGS